MSSTIINAGLLGIPCSKTNYESNDRYSTVGQTPPNVGEFCVFAGGSENRVVMKITGAPISDTAIVGVVSTPSGVNDATKYVDVQESGKEIPVLAAAGSTFNVGDPVFVNADGLASSDPLGAPVLRARVAAVGVPVLDPITREPLADTVLITLA